MLSAPKTPDHRDPAPSDAKAPNKKGDSSADFIHDLAESGTANELGTVKAASDAVESETDKSAKPAPAQKKRDE